MGLRIAEFGVLREGGSEGEKEGGYGGYLTLGDGEG